MERLRIIDALNEAGGNKKQAARTLGIHRSTLYAKLRKLGLAGQAGPGNGNSRESRQTESDLATVSSSR
jgi:transposase-like protein